MLCAIEGSYSNKRLQMDGRRQGGGGELGGRRRLGMVDVWGSTDVLPGLGLRPEPGPGQAQPPCHIQHGMSMELHVNNKNLAAR